MNAKVLQRITTALCMVMVIFLFQTVQAGETHITDTQTYYTDYFTSFYFKNGNDFYQEADGTLHQAVVDNYELFYLRSDDNGATWAKEKIVTGHDGDVYLAALTVDHNGKVFIGFTAHDYFNYGNPTGITFGKEFYYDVYCANNTSGSWAVESIYQHSSSNYGGKVAAMVVDGNNDVHLFANRYGWWTNGGEAWEWTRSAATGTWGPQVTAASFSDTSVDRFIYGYYRPVISSSGTITLVMLRYKALGGTNDELFYVTKSAGTWSAPTVIDTGFTRLYAGERGFDAAIDPNDNIHLVYWKDRGDDAAEVLYSMNFGTPEVFHTGYIGVDKREEIWDLKLHSNSAGDLTSVIRHGYRFPDKTTEVMNTSLVKRPAGGAWSALSDLPITAPEGDVFHESMALTDTQSGVFGDFQMTYMDLREVTTSGGPYGPYEVYHYAEETGPVPDVKANGVDGPLVISAGDPLEVAVSLAPGNQAGQPADWWVVAESPMGYYWYTKAGDWIPSSSPIVTHTGPLFDLAPYTILNMSGLPVGDYIFYFAVDDNQDGKLDADHLDQVDVTIQ